MDRLELICKTAALIRVNIENNKNVYSGLMVPNIQSIIDLTCLEDSYLVGLEDQLNEIEKELSTGKPLFTNTDYNKEK